MEKEALDNDKVLLWGENPIKSTLLKQYDKGNKNPFSNRKKKEPKVNDKEKPKPNEKREFTVGEDYGIKDLPFLNEEYERLDKIMSRKDIQMDELEELMDVQEKLTDLIEGLEQMKKITGGKIIDETPKQEKVSLKSVSKSTSSKARVEKGSEQAKELGKRLAEARKAKKALQEPKQEEKQTKPLLTKKKGKPWFYIGDIPKGYREATEDEAILAKKVSHYGKHIVDMEKWRLYRDYDIFLTDDKTNQEIIWSMSGLKRRIMNSLKDIEIYSSKLDNDKYANKSSEFKNKLEDEKDKRKYLQAGWNWYYKLLCERTNKKYERQKFELPKKEIKITKSEEVEWKPPPKPIDPRTGKPAETYLDIISKENSSYYDFGLDDKIISLKKSYFDNDKLKSNYVIKLKNKGVILQPEYYNKEDLNKLFYKRL